MRRHARSLVTLLLRSGTRLGNDHSLAYRCVGCPTVCCLPVGSGTTIKTTTTDHGDDDDNQCGVNGVLTTGDDDDHTWVQTTGTVGVQIGVTD